MKTVTQLFGLLFLMMVMTACPGGKETTDVTPVGDDYQKAIDAKLAALGWDKDGHARLNGSLPVKTSGGTGYVQYYAIGSGQAAIYYFPGKGAFGVNEVEMKAYDALGQDKWGLVVSDPKGTVAGGCGHNEVILVKDNSEGIITCNIVLYGPIYAKYKELKRWDGPLGLPTAAILDTPNKAVDGGTFGTFKNGVIWNTTATKANAIWGKVLKLYAAIDYERSWLGFPKESCDPNKGDASQRVVFQKGAIGVGSDGACGNYYNASGLSVTNKGVTSSYIPCYY